MTVFSSPFLASRSAFSALSLQHAVWFYLPIDRHENILSLTSSAIHRRASQNNMFQMCTHGVTIAKSWLFVVFWYPSSHRAESKQIIAGPSIIFLLPHIFQTPCCFLILFSFPFSPSFHTPRQLPDPHHRSHSCNLNQILPCFHRHYHHQCLLATYASCWSVRQAPAFLCDIPQEQGTY